MSELVQILLASVAVLVAFTVSAIKIGSWKGRVDSDRKNFDSFIDEMRDMYQQILVRLPQTVAVMNSPLKLTTLGEAISNAVDAPAWVGIVAPTLKEGIKDKHPYEIQEMCIDRASTSVEDNVDLRVRVYDAAYDHGVSTDKVFEVMGIKLRDAVMSEKQGISGKCTEPRIEDTRHPSN